MRWMDEQNHAKQRALYHIERFSKLNAISKPLQLRLARHATHVRCELAVHGSAAAAAHAGMAHLTGPGAGAVQRPCAVL